jgi:hypothetical protein
MADIARSAKLSPEMSRCMFAPQTKAPAGEALAAGDVVYQKAADGKLYKTTGAAATEPARFWGICPRAYAIGEPAVAFGIGAKIGRYCNVAQNVGTKLFISATAGALADAASTGGTVQVARVVAPVNGGATGTDIEIVVQASN